jgi:hypothetical protein
MMSTHRTRYATLEIRCKIEELVLKQATQACPPSLAGRDSNRERGCRPSGNLRVIRAQGFSPGTPLQSMEEIRWGYETPPIFKFWKEDSSGFLRIPIQ